MDELEISGKRYISSRRAGKQYHYHSDYIGQLVRGGKVIGTKVGRAWYVDEISLAGYLGKEAPAPLVKAVAPAAPTSVSAPAVIPVIPVESMPAAIRVPTQTTEFASVRMEAKPEVFQKHAEEIIVSVSHGDVWKEKGTIEKRDESEYRIPIQKKGLTYVEDTEPLLPEIRSNITRMPVRIAEPAAAIAPAPKVFTRVEKKAPLPVLSIFVLFIAGAAILSAVTIGSSFVMSRVVVEQGKPASVGFSLDR